MLEHYSWNKLLKLRLLYTTRDVAAGDLHLTEKSSHSLKAQETHGFSVTCKQTSLACQLSFKKRSGFRFPHSLGGVRERSGAQCVNTRPELRRGRGHRFTEDKHRNLVGATRLPGPTHPPTLSGLRARGGGRGWRRGELEGQLRAAAASLGSSSPADPERSRATAPRKGASSPDLRQLGAAAAPSCAPPAGSGSAGWTRPELHGAPGPARW